MSAGDRQQAVVPSDDVSRVRARGMSLRLSGVCVHDLHQGFATSHHQAASIHTNDFVALHCFQFLIDPQSRSTEQIGQLSLCQLQAKVILVAIARSAAEMAARQESQVLASRARNSKLLRSSSYVLSDRSFQSIERELRALVALVMLSRGPVVVSAARNRMTGWWETTPVDAGRSQRRLHLRATRRGR